MNDYTFSCPNPECKEEICLTDVFRLHQAIDNDTGAAGILGYTVTLMEQIVLIHIIRIMVKLNLDALKKHCLLKMVL
ncbi:hypothetical protein [Halanaerobium praevalens]|uniref:hypothetical protein n=1 Tax=Halanaerobium praevalens TaxID=2331 RepID=UPI0002EB7275|nr:hypothetical protein [Halanaerobium praevalens]